jgi:hypothetical protein
MERRPSRGRLKASLLGSDASFSLFCTQRAHIEKLTPYVLYKWPTHKKLAVRAPRCPVLPPSLPPSLPPLLPPLLPGPKP